MDSARVARVRDTLARSPWSGRTRDFARSVRTCTREPGGLLLVGTEQEEPWHLAAHLDDEARWTHQPQLRPTLLRWAPPAGAAPHLAVGLDRLDDVRRGETVLVVSPEVTAPTTLLERVADARRAGATVLTIEGGDEDLQALAHDALTVPPHGVVVPGTRHLGRRPDDLALSIDLVQHLVSLAVGGAEAMGHRGARPAGRRLRQLLGRR